MTDTDITTPDEAQAVVELTSEEMIAAVKSEPGRAFSGHTSRRYVDESIEASAVIERYALIDSDAKFVPMITTPLEQLAEDMAGETGRSTDDQLFLIAEAMKDRRISRRGYLGGVSLDLNPEVNGMPQDLGHPDVPAVLFYEVYPGQMLATCGHCDVCRGDAPEDVTICRNHVSAIAVWFQPDVDELGYAVKPRRGKGGRLYSDDTFLEGYLGIIERFASLRAASQAMRELQRAVRTLATDDSADEPDRVRESGLAEDERSDRAAARAARSGRSAGRERGAF